MTLAAARLRTRSRRLAGSWLPLLVTLLLALPAAALVHTRLLRTDPADEALAAGPVHTVRLWFSTPVDVTRDAVEITGPDGRRVDGRSARTTAEDPSVVEAPVDGRAAGRYAVRWTVISVDGHPITGTFGFVVEGGAAAPDTAAAPAPVAQEPPPPVRVPVGREAAAAGRGLHYAALAIALGSLLFGALVLRGAPAVPPLAHARVWAIAALGAALLFPAAVLTIVAQAAAIAGSYAGGVRQDALDPVLGSRWGTLWQLRLGLAALLIWLTADGVFRGRRRGGAAGASTWRMVAALATGAALVVLTALDGHPASTPPVALSVTVDAVHLLATCAWVGGLAALIGVFMPALRPLAEGARAAALAAVVPRFSMLALAAVLTLVATGLYQSWRLVGGPAQLIGTDYGRLLLLKLGLFALLLIPAAINRFMLKPRLRANAPAAPFALAATGGAEPIDADAGHAAPAGPEGEAPRAGARVFERLVRTELGLALAVLAVVAVLTGIEPPRGGDPAAEDAAGFVFEPPLPAPAIRAELPDGRSFDLAADDAAASLVFFGFTRCPDFCPTTLSKWARVRALLGDEAARTRFVFVSVDPARDTPALAHAYARGFDPSFIGIAPDSAEVARIESGFFLRSMRSAPPPDPATPAGVRTAGAGAATPAAAGDGSAAHAGHEDRLPDYDVMHSTRFFLVGPAGAIRVMYAHDAPAEAVAADIRRLLR